MAIAPKRRTNANEVIVSWGGGRIYEVDLSSNVYGTIANTQITELLDSTSTNPVIGSISFTTDGPSPTYSVSSLLYIENKIYAICVSNFNSVLTELTVNGINDYQLTRTIHLSGNWDINNPSAGPYIIKQVPGSSYYTEFPVLSGQQPLYTADSIISIGNNKTMGNTIFDNLYIYFRRPTISPPISTFIPDTPLLYKLDLVNSDLVLVRDIIQLGISPTNISPFLNT